MLHRIVLIIGLVIIGIGAFYWLKYPNSYQFPIAFTVVGVVVSFLFWVPSISVNKSRKGYKQWEARLIVIADKSRMSQEVRLLPSEYWSNMTRDTHWALTVKRIVLLPNQRRPHYGVDFRDLEPGEYMVWADEVSAIPVDLYPGQVQTIELPLPYKTSLG